MRPSTKRWLLIGGIGLLTFCATSKVASGATAPATPLATLSLVPIEKIHDSEEHRPGPVEGIWYHESVPTERQQKLNEEYNVLYNSSYDDLTRCIKLHVPEELWETFPPTPEKWKDAPAYLTVRSDDYISKNHWDADKSTTRAEPILLPIVSTGSLHLVVPESYFTD